MPLRRSLALAIVVGIGGSLQVEKGRGLSARVRTVASAELALL